MSAQLSQLLSQLDRPGATELIIATGRQVAVRVNGVFQTLTASGVTLAQLMHLIRDTQLSSMVPASEKVGDPVSIDLDGRSLLAQFVRQGADVMLRIEHRPAPQPRARPTTPPAPAGGVPAATTSIRITPARSSEIPLNRAATSSTPIQGTPAIPDTTYQSTRNAAAAIQQSDPAYQSTRNAAAFASGSHRGHPSTPPLGSAGKPPQLAVASPAVAAPAMTVAMPVMAPMPAPIDPRREPVEHKPIAGLVDEPCEIAPALIALINEARRRNATDLHVAANRPVVVRTIGELVPLDPTIMPAADVEAMLLPLLGPLRRQQLTDRGYVDLAVDAPGAGRLRTNISRHQGGLKGAFRLAVHKPPSLEQLGLPAAVAKVTDNHQGLVVIAGPSGHGKTTTLAALVDLLNRADPIHILTIEDPVEIVHPKQAAVVSQREVGRHTVSFAAALKASLREDPDVIVIGELRDRETVEIALTAAETGHLVLATMSTPSAAKTIDRLVDMFPPADQQQVRASLGAALKAIVAQRLLPNVDGTGVVAAVELLVGVLALANLIRDNKLFQLPNLMQRGKAFGMIRLDDSLLELVRAGKLAEDIAIKNADNKKELVAALHPTAAEPKRGGLFGRRDRE